MNCNPTFRFRPPALVPAMARPQDGRTTVVTTQEWEWKRNDRRLCFPEAEQGVSFPYLHGVGFMLKSCFLPVLHEVVGKHPSVAKLWQKDKVAGKLN